MGLGSDGCTVMFGANGGVGVKLKRLIPHLIHFHCPAHRLQLAILEVAEKNVLRSFVLD